jgi:hypothetical protein
MTNAKHHQMTSGRSVGARCIDENDRKADAAIHDDILRGIRPGRRIGAIALAFSNGCFPTGEGFDVGAGPPKQGPASLK